MSVIGRNSSDFEVGYARSGILGPGGMPQAAGTDLHRIQTARLDVVLRIWGKAELARDPQAQRTLLLCGEVYGWPTPACDSVLRRYGEIGDGVWRELNGSWSAVLIDAREDRLRVVTDRCNSRRVLAWRDGQVHRLGSAGCPTFPTDRAPDPAGVAWFLTHGATYAGRTVYQGVEFLAGASIHDLWPQSAPARRYWRYDFAPGPQSPSDLQHELQHLLVDAVRRRIGDGQGIVVSLSAGYDVSGILGVLGSSLRVPGVRCFSYSDGTTKPGSDEYVSRQMAGLYGYEHRVIRGFDGNLDDVLRENATRGRGFSPPCDEVQVWRQLSSEWGDGCAIFTGDECLGWTDYRLRSDEQVLRAVNIHGSRTLGCLRGWLPAAACDSVAEQMAQDVRTILAMCEGVDDPHDRKDLLYLHARLGSTIMPWRECHTARCGAVRTALLDSHLLDFMRKVPPGLRRQKRLYRRTIRSMFPEIFRIPRARFATYQVPIGRCASAMSADSLRHESRLDELIRPDLVAHLLAASARRPVAGLGKRAIELGKGLLLAAGVKNGLRPYFQPPAAGVSTEALLWRLLVLRRVFEC